MRQHEAIVQRRAPADEAAIERRGPEACDEGADEELLREVHAGVGRHLEAAEFDEAEAAGRAIGGIELVDADFAAVGVAGDIDEEIAEQAVGEPGERRGALAGSGHLGKRDLELVEAVVAGFVDARGLRGRDR